MVSPAAFLAPKARLSARLEGLPSQDTTRAPLPPHAPADGG